MHSACLCSKKQTMFSPYIIYRNETVFKDFEGIIIGKCKRCGLLKTFPPKNILFDPQQSRKDMYESRRNYFINILSPIVEKIKKYKPFGNVLDVGCSSGLLLELLRKEKYDVCGIEPNKKAFAVAKRKFGKNVFFGTLHEFYYSVLLRCNRKRFDVIIYNHVFEHVDDIKTELTLIRRILKKDGIFVLGLPNTDNYIFFLRGKYWEPLMPLEHIWHFSKNYLISYLKQNGFTVINSSFSDDRRTDYPALKRLYFTGLSIINKLFYTGEVMLLVAKKNE